MITISRHSDWYEQTACGGNEGPTPRWVKLIGVTVCPSPKGEDMESVSALG